jgi:rhodanese-related sulfurtransferase
MGKSITRADLQAKLDRGDEFTLVETLPATSFQEGHLPGAINLPPDRIQELAPRLLPAKDADIVVYCAKST